MSVLGEWEVRYADPEEAYDLEKRWGYYRPQKFACFPEEQGRYWLRRGVFHLNPGVPVRCYKKER